MKVIESVLYRGKDNRPMQKLTVVINLAARIIKRIKREYLLVFLHSDTLEIVSRKNRHYIYFGFMMRDTLADWLSDHNIDFCPTFLSFENIVCQKKYSIKK